MSGKWNEFISTVFSRLNAGGVYFKLGPVDPAFIWSRRLIGGRRLLTKWLFCFFFLPFYQVDLLLPNFRGPGKVGQDGTIFPFTQTDKLSVGQLQSP